MRTLGASLRRDCAKKPKPEAKFPGYAGLAVNV